MTNWHNSCHFSLRPSIHLDCSKIDIGLILDWGRTKYNTIKSVNSNNISPVEHLDNTVHQSSQFKISNTKSTEEKRKRKGKEMCKCITTSQFFSLD